MTGPSDHADLFGLLRGDVSTSEALAIGDHLGECTPCRDELAALAVGNAVLVRTDRTDRGRLPTVGESPDDDALPPLLPLHRSRGRFTRLGAAAAAVVLVAGAGGVAVTSLDDGPEPATEQVAPLGALLGSSSGEVHFVRGESGTRVTIVTHDLAEAGTGSYYQAWLLDPVTNKMLALGPIAGESSDFTVDPSLLASYHAVDVSLETDDGNPAHSATSVLRGAY